jgi:acetyltransferase-like isoleucine patch superfamily enzyme
MMGRLTTWWRQPLSRKLQYISMRRTALVTRWLYRWRLHACGQRSIVSKPLFWTPEFISLGDDVLIWPGCRIEGVTGLAGSAPRIDIEDGVTMQQHCHITAASTLHIGAGTTVLSNVVITDMDHGYETIGVRVCDQAIAVKDTWIGRQCFVGAGARILAGTRLGDHCVVGANAVVRGEFPVGSVIVGSPARVVRTFDVATRTWRKAPADPCPAPPPPSLASTTDEIARCIRS